MSAAGAAAGNAPAVGAATSFAPPCIGASGAPAACTSGIAGGACMTGAPTTLPVTTTHVTVRSITSWRTTGVSGGRSAAPWICVSLNQKREPNGAPHGVVVFDGAAFSAANCTGAAAAGIWESGSWLTRKAAKTPNPKLSATTETNSATICSRTFGNIRPRRNARTIRKIPARNTQRRIITGQLT
jgi:hypothetical protein